jgi:hypothetical protein
VGHGHVFGWAGAVDATETPRDDDAFDGEEKQ